VKKDKNEECLNYTKGCWNYTHCDEESGECVRQDTCQSNKCETFVCSEEGTCIGTPVPSPFQNTSCIEYKCDPLIGWNISLEKTVQYCYDHDPDKSCKNFYCDVNEPGGCTYDVIDECDEKCTPEFVAGCLEEGHKASTTEECKLLICKVRQVEYGSGYSSETSQDTEPYCKLNRTINCFTSSAADEARMRNEGNNDLCFNVGCDHGQCVLFNTEKPDDDDACQKYVCVYSQSDHMWSWELEDTDEKKKCVSDECYDRYCDAGLGCVKTDICRNKSTECTTYSCENKKCIPKETPRKETECTIEKCEDGKIVVKQKPLDKSCPNTNKCLEAVCTEMGTCMFRNTTHNTDPCMITVCDPDKGWVSTPKCDDGLFCTVDKCTVKGECRHTPVNCYLEIDMSEHPCFRAVCKEDTAKGNYTCTRKKKDGVYIDVCGNCLRLEDTEGSSSENWTDPTTDCANAPDEYIPKKELAAATIAMIVLGAIIIGAAVGTTTVIGTKTLLEHARAANNQSAHSNPLFEGDQTEMNNPAFAGEEH